MNHGNLLNDFSPAVNPPALRIQEASIVAPEASLLVSESTFSESVPLSSTIRDPSSDVAATSINKVWADRARVERIADQVCIFLTCTIRLFLSLWKGIDGSKICSAGAR